MRDCVVWRYAPGLALIGWLGTYASIASAQTAAPSASTPPAAAPAAAAPAAAAPQAAPPPPAAYPPPAGAYQTYPAYPAPAYGVAPPGYPPPPPGYAYAYPTAPRPPESVPYDGGPIPTGYHLEERPRRGPVIAGTVIVASAYALGLTVASTDNFPNSTGWLVVPVVGPWITLAARHQTQDCVGFNSTGDICANTDENNTTRTFLVLDGLTQATGAILLIYGLASPKKVVARDFVGRLEFTPAQLGKSGFGGFVMGSF